jgi:hypothetical protein
MKLLLEDLRTWEELTPDEQWETLAKFELWKMWLKKKGGDDEVNR